MLPSLVPIEKRNFLAEMAKKALILPEGDIWECGVYKGGTAEILSKLVPKNRNLVLFDSFEGLPEACEHDNHHKKGDFSDTFYERIANFFAPMKNVQVVKGWIPETFKGFEDRKIALLHLDLDLYQGYKDTLEFVWPRLVEGGIIVLDDYSAWSCLGAKKATDEFLTDKKEKIHQDAHNTWIVKGA